MSKSMSGDLTKIALALCDGYASELGLKVKSLISQSLWDELASLRVDPSVYASSEAYFADVCAVSFLKKYEALPTTIDRKAVAVENFWSAERECFRTNQRLLPFIHGTYAIGDEAILEFISQVRKEVVELIGERPPSNPQGRFGPGSTFSDRGSLATIPDKMQSRPCLTNSSWAYLVPWGGTLWAQACAVRDDSICFVPGNRFTTVPKDCTKDRGISIEPSINLFYQLAYGKAMRERLKQRSANRLDLATAANIHRQVARESSISGRYATIDLSQASDTVSYSFVKSVLPHQWFEPLDDLRSPKTLINHQGQEKWVKLEKFSSMGNGYTFELETVLFMAVCAAVMRRKGHKPLPGMNLHVFGDDIIVQTEFASEVISALQFFGMKTNKDKTFVSGPFRESCGGDFFNGVDVRPYYQKKEVYEPQHFIAMANGIRRMAASSSNTRSRWPFIMDAWFRVLDNIPIAIRRCRGPQALGDIVIHDEPERWETSTWRSRRYFRCYKPATYREVKFSVFDPDVQLAAAVYGVTVTGDGRLRPRDSVTGYRLGRVEYS